MARAAARLKSVPPQISASYQWHNDFHTGLAQERLSFWLLNYQRSLRREDIFPKLREALNGLGVRSYVAWEVFGDTDVVLRTWLSPTVRSNQVRQGVIEAGFAVRNLAVEATLKHWIWDSVKPASADMFQDVNVEDLADINGGVADRAVVAGYVDKGYLRQIATPEARLKFFLLARPSEEAKDEVITEFGLRLSDALRAFPELQHASLYKFSGEGYRYLLTGRVMPDEFEWISRTLVARVYADGLGFTTVTYLATTDTAPLRQEAGVLPFGVGEQGTTSSAPGDADRPSAITPIESLLIAPEDSHLEVKGSAFVDVRRLLETGERVDKETNATASLIKAIVGFMNNQGGALLVGAVEDADFYGAADALAAAFGPIERFNDYHILGVEHEYPKKGFDGYERSIRQAVENRIDPGGLAGSLIEIQPVRYNDRTLCLINVRPPATLAPMYAIEQSNYRFYVRQGNRTIELKGSAIEAHQENRRPPTTGSDPDQSIRSGTRSR